MSGPNPEHDRRCFEALKSLGRTIGQMNLYHPAHPAVQAMLSEDAGALAQLLAQVPSGELVYCVDAGSVIEDGRIIGALENLPSSVGNTFSRLKLSSLALARGVTQEELSVFCQLASMQAEALKGVDAAGYLRERGVEHIRLNETLYAKVESAPEAEPVALPAAVAPEPESLEPVAEAIEKLEGEPLEAAIEALARRAGANAAQCTRIRDAVMRRVRAELEQKVGEATRELKRHATVLTNEQARTQAVLSNMAEGVVVVDDAGRVLMMNPAAEELYGARLSELAGKPLSEHSREEHLLAMSREAVVPDDKPLAGDIAIVAQDDARRTLRASAAIVQTEGGKTLGMVSALSDAAKFRELQNMQREFVAHVTHELRSPLTAIRAALEILEGAVSGKIGADEKRIMTNALRNTDRLEDLVNSILDFSKIEAGQMTVHPQRCDPESLAREAIDSMSPWATKKDLHLVLGASSGLPPVSADPKRTVQVLINLLSNAIKFTPAKGRIRLNVAPGADPAKFVQFNVSDTGPGIAKEDQQKIFRKFVQIAAGERHVGGTGLGLAIAKAFVQLQRGQMWIESEPGHGANFLFTVPVYVPPPEERALTPKPVLWWKRLLGYR